MTFKTRIALIVAASVMGFGVAVGPMAMAAESTESGDHMMKSDTGKMKDHAMKGDAMKGHMKGEAMKGHMKGDAMKSDAPAQ